MKEEFDYSRLLGKIVEKFNTREKFATAMNLSADSISDKLNNKTIWKQSDIDKATYLLNIDTTEIGLYFFYKKKFEHNGFWKFEQKKPPKFGDWKRLLNHRILSTNYQQASKIIRALVILFI
ncbi:DUF739 family protein [Streptococcus penaeicida]|uniref:DUF739 family protein n=1 Tax=Streptococcus penaeicida TaxID=1765960 RepID=UPI000C9B6EB8